MSYSVVYLPIKTVQGETVLVADVPVEELTKTTADVMAAKAVAIWPTLMSQTMSQIDSYAEQKLWPAIRAEVDRATAQAETRMTEVTKSASKQVTWVGLLAAVGIAGVGLYVYSWKR
jgi:hypothetical protein